jgi:hypothetical protein
VGSISDEVTGFLDLPNPSNPIIVLEFTQLLTKLVPGNLPGI